MSQTTKRALEASLKKLLLEKPLNKITINDITEDCGVNRMTFYYHFKDIYDLVDWILVEDAAKALEGRQSFETWTEAFLDILHQIQENKVLVLNVYRSVGREQVEQYLYKMLDPMLKDFADRECRDITVQDDDKQFVVDFYKYALVGVVLEWVRRDMKTDPAICAGRCAVWPATKYTWCRRTERRPARQNFIIICAVMGFPSRCFFCLWQVCLKNGMMSAIKKDFRTYRLEEKDNEYFD